MNLKRIFILSILFLVIGVIFLFNINKSYSYGLMLKISGSKGNYTLKYYDADSGVEVSMDTAVKFYGATEYMELYHNGSNVYFHRGRQIDKKTYDIESQGEQADIRVRNYGTAAYRTKNTEDVKKAIDDIYKNLRIGTFYLEFSPYEYKNTIDWQAINNYYLSNYGVTNPYKNYYTYEIKGPYEPERFNFEHKYGTYGEIELSTLGAIRITSNEQKVVDTFLAKILPLMKGDGSDYQKILAAYTYITKTTSYITDNGFVDDLLASNTSTYDVFINRKSVCIGYSIAFSYLMDKLGIESYIVDSFEYISPEERVFKAVHTYNIVKLDGKFYKVDLTGNVFLSGISAGELYNSNLNISKSAYNFSGKTRTYNFDYNSINNYLADAKRTKTTTTTTARKTTTLMRTTKFPTTTTKKGQTTTSDSASIIYTTTNNMYIPNETTTSINSFIPDDFNPDNNFPTTNQSGENNGVGNNEEPTTIKDEILADEQAIIEHKKEKKKVNIILISLALIILFLFIISKRVGKKKKRYDDDITEILNRSIYKK